MLFVYKQRWLFQLPCMNSVVLLSFPPGSMQASQHRTTVPQMQRASCGVDNKKPPGLLPYGAVACRADSYSHQLSLLEREPQDCRNGPFTGCFRRLEYPNTDRMRPMSPLRDTCNAFCALGNSPCRGAIHLLEICTAAMVFSFHATEPTTTAFLISLDNHTAHRCCCKLTFCYNRGPQVSQLCFYGVCLHATGTDRSF